MHMQNSWRVFTRDLKRIARVPKAWIIIIGLIVMPSMYAWFNIVAFWDPYGDTKAVKVAIVNLDEGAYSSVTGDLNVGDKVVAQLKDNHQLGWQFLDEEEAMTAVRSGESYAAIVMPKEFSRDLLSIMTGDFIKPEIDYYVNQKANAIAPKITGVGASTLETQINSTFVSTVAETVAEDLKGAGVVVGERMLDAKNSTLSSLETTVERLESAREGVADIEDTLVDAGATIAAAKNTMASIDGTAGEVQVALVEAEALVAELQSDLVEFTSEVTNAYASSSAALTQAVGKLNANISAVTQGAQEANHAIGSVINEMNRAVVEINDHIEVLKAVCVDNGTPYDPSDPGACDVGNEIKQLEDELTLITALLTDLGNMNTDVGNAITAIQGAADAINQAVQDTANAASGIGSALTSTIPSIHRSMAQLSASAGAFSSALDAQRSLMGESINLLTGLEDQLVDTRAALESLDGNLAGAEESLDNLMTDVNALSSAELLNQVSALTSLSPERIAEFMASPVEVKEHALFPVAAYGSAMAPLFTNLALWIGAFMLVVLLKQEVDVEGVEGLTVREAYFGRWMLLAALNICQVLLVSIGNLVIGVQTVSAVAFVATSVVIGLVFVSIIFALALSFGYIGKGIAILLVMLQIPGASGIYPIEMMPDFFRSLYPFLPFTYGIDTLRETIGGFYDGYYWRSFAMLMLFAALSFFLGLYLRQRLGNFARLFNRNLASTGLFVTEDVRILGSRRRLTQLAQALSNRKQFIAETKRKQQWFTERHLTLIRLTILVGVVLTALLLVIAWLFPAGKSTVLGVWGLVLLVLIGFVVALEYIKQNIVYAIRVGKMDDPELQQELLHEEAASRSNTVLASLKDRGRHR